MSTNKPNWPLFKTHDDARCPCGSPLHNPVYDGYAPGSGEFRGACHVCSRYTWYDVEKSK